MLFMVRMHTLYIWKLLDGLRLRNVNCLCNMHFVARELSMRVLLLLEHELFMQCMDLDSSLRSPATTHCMMVLVSAGLLDTLGVSVDDAEYYLCLDIID